MLTLEEMLFRIDFVADAQRNKLVGDALKAFEYQAAKEGALLYQSNGFSGTVPAVVKSWAEARGWTNQQAAENILQEAAMFIGALELIRDIRLKGKYALIALSEEDREVEFRQVISNLKAVG